MSPAGGSPAPARPTVGTAEHDPAVLPLHLWPSTLGFAGVWLISFGFVLVELLRRQLDHEAGARFAVDARWCSSMVIAAAWPASSPT